MEENQTFWFTYSGKCTGYPDSSVLLRSPQTLVAKGQTTPTLRLSTHPLVGRAETSGSQLGHTTCQGTCGNGRERGSGGQQDWRALLVKCPEKHGHMTNFLISNANDILKKILPVFGHDPGSSTPQEAG